MTRATTLPFRAIAPITPTLAKPLAFPARRKSALFLPLWRFRILPADVSLVNFDSAIKNLVHLAPHGCAPTLTNVPACVVVVGRFFAEDHPVNLKGADPLLRSEHQESDLE